MNNSRLRKRSIIFLAAFCLSFAADVHAPKPFKTILEDATGKTWTPGSISAVENRAHVVFIDNTGSYCLRVGSEISGSLVAGEIAALKDGTGTYSDALRSMFQLLDLNTATLATDDLTGTYTIHPELASYYAVDVEGDALTVRDKSSFYHEEQTTKANLSIHSKISIPWRARGYPRRFTVTSADHGSFLSGIQESVRYSVRKYLGFCHN